MPRIPLAAAFSIQIIVSLIAVASIVAVFAVINNNAVQTAAQDSAISSVKVAQEIIASPFKAVIPEIIALASSLKEKGALCTTYNVMGPLMVPQLQQMIPVLESNPQFFAVYQTYRLAIPYNPANTGSHSNYDYPWGDCGCVSDPNPLNNFCLHSQLIDPTIYGINTGWSLSSGLLPVNATPTGINPIDSAPFKYTQTIMKLTKEQAGGFWGTPEVYPLPDRLVPYVTFHVPLLFDDVTGFCTLAQNSDVNMGWLAGYLAQRDSPASHTIVIDLRASIILATSFDIPAFYIPNASEPLQNGQNWNITETPDPKLNDAVRRLLDYTSGNLSSISDPVVLIGSNTVVGAGKLQIGSLALLAVVVTDSSYFFQTGQQALITAILVGVAGFLLLAANVVVTVLATVRPLQDVSKRMQHTAQLRPGDELADFSSINEIRALQKSYCQMNVAVQSFVRYVPKDVVVDLLHAGQLCRISMDPMRVTIFFADVMNFTSICERVPPSELSDLILEYFNVTSRIVMRHGGIIDKFIGDCIMAIWGAPFLVASHEAKAVLCGLEVQRATHTPPCSVSFQAAGEVLGTRIGINCGEALAGNMGSHERMNYTVIGDAVNLAARLEGLGKQFNSAFLASEAVIAPHKDFFCTRFLCPVNVVGKDEPVNVYEVIGLWPDMNPNTLPHDDLVHIQGPTKDPNFSDQSDTASSISRMSQQTDVFRGETLQNLAREAIEPRHGVPLVVSDEMARRVLEYNKIVRLCIKRDAVAASTYLRELRRLAEEKPLAEADVGMKRLTQVGGPNDKAATILESWCDELSSLSPRAQTQWVSVYKADSK